MSARNRKVEADSSVNWDKMPKSDITIRAEKTIKDLVLAQVLIDELNRKLVSLSNGILEMDRQLRGK